MYVPASESKMLIDDWVQEFILLLDVLGLSLLVDSIDHPRPKGSTEGTFLGPFHAHDAEKTGQTGLISHDPDGETLLVVCTLKYIDGKPISGAKIDVW
jgi:protocatechuate 3,4-dioxygenase beta subunit